MTCVSDKCRQGRDACPTPDLCAQASAETALFGLLVIVCILLFAGFCFTAGFIFQWTFNL